MGAWLSQDREDPTKRLRGNWERACGGDFKHAIQLSFGDDDYHGLSKKAEKESGGIGLFVEEPFLPAG